MAKSITITGSLGSGKSTVAHMLAACLGYTYYSTGLALRHTAEQMGISTLDLSLKATRDPTIDESVDGVFKQMNTDKTPYVVDSRLAWHFMPDSFKVKLIADEDIAAERIMHDTTRIGERSYPTLEDAKQAIRTRRQSEVVRFLRTYNVDIESDEPFDLIVDTTHLTPDQVCASILSAYQSGK